MSETALEPTADATVDPVRPILDREHLIKGEKVIWESRPAWIIVLLRPLIMIIVAIIYAAIMLTYDGSLLSLIIALVLAGLMTPFDRRFGIPAAIAGIVVAFLVSIDRSLAALALIPLVLGAIPLITTYLYWRRTVFALTDRRIISQYGFMRLYFSDTGLDKVQNISLNQPFVERLFGFGDISIATSGEMGRTLRRLPGIRLRSGAMVWENVPKPFDVQKMLSSYVYRPVAPVPP